MVGSCYFCKAEYCIDPKATDLLLDGGLKQFIIKRFPTWIPSERSTCLQCLGRHYEDYTAHHSGVVNDVPSRTGSRPEGAHTVISDETPFKDFAEPNSPSLIIIHGLESEIGKKIALPQDQVVSIGRTEEATIQIIKDNVSRNHAKIFFQDGEYRIVDLGSTNGTFLNTVKISSESLHSGDVILIGNTIFKFLLNAFDENFYNTMFTMAAKDGLTKVFNKRFIVDKLKYEIDRALRYRRPLSMLMIDIDHFKDVNDNYGHLAGDCVLEKSAEIFLQNLRNADLVGRYGGEEFLVILPECPIDQAIRTAEKIRSIVEQSVFRYDAIPMQITLSIGVSALTADAKDPEFLVKTADRALYIAKRNGRNQIFSLQKPTM